MRKVRDGGELTQLLLDHVIRKVFCAKMVQVRQEVGPPRAAQTTVKGVSSSPLFSGRGSTVFQVLIFERF